MLGSKGQREDVAQPFCALVILFTWESFRATSILVKRRVEGLDGHSLCPPGIFIGSMYPRLYHKE